MLTVKPVYKLSNVSDHGLIYIVYIYIYIYIYINSLNTGKTDEFWCVILYK